MATSIPSANKIYMLAVLGVIWALQPRARNTCGKSGNDGVPIARKHGGVLRQHQQTDDRGELDAAAAAATASGLVLLLF
ncbi:hypothetical protein ACLOJK_005999 [Asimina triloba]